MADNVATALKNLNKELNEADVKIRAAQGDSQALFDAIVRGVGISKDSFRSLVSELSSKDIKGARTIDIVTRLVDENGKKLTPASIKATIKNITKDNKPQTLGLFQYKTSDLNTLQQMLAKSKEDAADLLSTVLKISNSSVGLNKAQGTAYSNALASRIKEEGRARDKIIKLQERQLQLEQAIDRASSNKSGKTKFEGKMRSVADLNKELADTARLISQQNAILQGSGRGQNVAKALGLGTAKKEADMLNNSLSKTIGLAQRLGNAFGIAFSAQGLVQFGRKLVETRGKFEKQFVAMKQIIGDVDQATKIWNQTMQQALQSPFKAMQLTDYTKRLAAYRIETDKLFDTTKRLADVSAGLGVDMGRLILAYGQVKTANYLRASEVRQFTEAGVNIYGELAKYFSELEGHAVSTAEVVERVTKRMVLFSDVEAIFKRMTDEGGIFFNMQEIQSDTVRGQIQKLHDAYDQMLNTIGQANQGTIRDLLESLNKLVRNWRDVVAFLKTSAITIGVLTVALKLNSVSWKTATASSIFFNKELEVGGVKLRQYRINLEAGAAATNKFTGFLMKLGGAARVAGAAISSLRVVWGIVGLVALEAIIGWITKLSDADRAAKQLKEDLEGIKFENSESLQSNIQGFERLKKAIEETNDGSSERLRLIEQMNNKYGDYLPHLVTEINTVQQLNDAYDSVVQSMREYSYAKTKEQGEERIRKEMFEVYNDVVNKLFRSKSNRQVSYGNSGSFYLEKNEIQDILKQVQDELVKDPDVNGATLVNRLIANYTGIQDAHVDYAHIWAGYVEDIRKQVKEMENLAQYAEDVVSPTYNNKDERDKAEELRKKAETALAAENEAWAKDKEFLTHKIEDSVLKGIQDARKKASSVDREDMESDASYNMRLWEAQIKADEDANKKIAEQHIITNFKIEEKEKEHQEKLLKIRLNNQQISAESYRKQMLSIYPELDDRIKQYNDKIRSMVVGQYGEDWKNNADAITLFKQMRVGIDDISQGVAQYQKNLAGTIENQIKIVQDLYDWKERGYNVDQNDLDVQREKLSVYVQMAKLLGVKTTYNPISGALFNDIQSKFYAKYGEKPIPYLPFGNTFFGMEEGDRMLSQLELLDKYTKKWQEYENTYKTLVQSRKNNAASSTQAVKELDAEIEEAKANMEASKYLIDLLGYVAKITTGGGGKNYLSISPIISLLKEMNSEYNKLSKSAYGFAKSQETVKEVFRESFKDIMKATNGRGRYALDKAFTMVNWDNLDITSNGGVADALQQVYNYLETNKMWGKFGKNRDEVKNEFVKEMSTWKVEAGIDVQVRIREDFARQMEEAFNNYDLTLELQNLGISEDMARDLFPDLDYTSIGKLQEIMKDFYETRQTKDEKGNVLFSEQDFKTYKEWADKVDAEILKARKDRAKQYSKYLEKEYSERAKLEIQYAKDVAFVTSTISDETQRDNILTNLNKKYQDNLNELNWKSFKESDFYIDMMDDITSLPKEYTQMMLDKIEEILQNPETLSPRALKEAINARQKVLEAQMNLDPLSVMQTSLSDMRKAKNEVGGSNFYDTKKKLNERVNALQEEINALEDNANSWDEKAANMKAYEDALDAVTAAKGRLTNATTKLVNEQGKEITKTQYQSEYTQNEKRIEELQKKQREGTIDNTEKDQLAGLLSRNRALKEQIEYIQQLIQAELALKAIRDSKQGSEAEDYRNLGFTSTDMSNNANSSRNQASNKKKQQQSLKEWLKSFDNFGEALKKLNANINSTLNSVAGMGNAFYDMFDALGGETNVLTEGWKEFGNTIISSISNALTMIPMMVAAFTAAGTAINSALGIIGIIAQALTVLMTVITAISKLHDAGVDYEIEKHKETLDDLIETYEDLEDAIKGAMSSAQYISDYDAAVQNLNQQIAEANAQIAVAQDYKNDDKREEAIENAEDAIEDATDKLKDLKKEMQDTFLGFNTDDFRSMTEDFVSAWLDAYEETGDGFDAMMDNFEETMKKWFIKQAVMRLAGAKMETLLNQMVAAIDEDGNGGVAANREEIEAIRERAALLFAGLNDDLKELYSIWGLGGDDTLSGLAAGIQGMTEEQANVLEAYWNSVRQMTASIDSNVASIALILGAGGVNTNPMLTHLQTIADNTSYIQSIYELLAPLQTNGGNGRGFRTYQM